MKAPANKREHPVRAGHGAGFPAGMPLGITLLVAGLFFLTSPARGQNLFVSLDGGFVFGGAEALYVDDPFDLWLDRTSGVVFGAEVHRRIAPNLFIGTYVEYESIDTDFDVDAGRLGFGGIFTGRYPDDLSGGIGFEMGGMVGAARATIDGWDDQFGLDYGVFLGPVINVTSRIQLGVHVQGLYGWYGGGTAPEGVQNVQPRLKAKLYIGL